MWLSARVCGGAGLGGTTGCPWNSRRFFFQLDGDDGWGPGDRYALNFGGGTGYGFLSQDRCEGRFFWDCVL
jgi:hypothetical protein